MSQQQLQQELLNISAAGRQQPEQAIARCESLLQQFPRLVPAWCLAGRFHRIVGNHEQAGTCLDEALSLDPAAVPAIAEKGQLAIATQRYSDAAIHLHELIELKPDIADNWFNLGMVEEKLGRFDAAASTFRSALERNPHQPAEIQVRLGGVLTQSGREEEAEQAFRQALDLDPESPDAHFGLGLLAVSEGRLDDGIGEFRQALEKKPHFAQAWQQIIEARRIEAEDDADLLAVRDILDRPGLSAEDQESLNFTLGKGCDDLGQYEKAFAHYLKANQLKRSRLPAFDTLELERSTDGLIEAGVEDQSATEVETAAVLPVFIIGLPRSGTTLVDQILTAHPGAAGLGESAFFQSALEGRPDDEWPGLKDGEIETMRSRYLEHLQEEQAGVVSNKYPANFRLVGLIRKVLPEARFVHVTRNPLDTGLSIFFQDFPTGNYYANDLSDLAAYISAYNRLMDKWRDVLGDESLLEISYEALLADQESESRRLLAFCGLDWDPTCLDFANNPRRVSTLSRWQVRQPLYSSSMGRSQHYEQYLIPLQQNPSETIE
ncbi:MAG: sulfotransferase [Gammaproteobacteria bacterium]